MFRILNTKIVKSTPSRFITGNHTNHSIKSDFNYVKKTIEQFNRIDKIGFLSPKSPSECFEKALLEAENGYKKYSEY